MFQLFQIFWKILIFSKKHRLWSQKWLIKSKISIWWETLFCDFYFFEFRCVIVKKKSGKKFIGGLLRMTCRPSVCGRPHPADTKIARERHKIQNFMKNGTYVKYNGLLRMPTNFFDDPTIFGDRSPQKPKRAIFGACQPAVNMPAAFCFFLALIVPQIHWNAGMLKIKGQFKVSWKKIGQNRILVKNFGHWQICPPPNLIRLAESPT